MGGLRKESSITPIKSHYERMASDNVELVMSPRGNAMRIEDEENHSL